MNNTFTFPWIIKGIEVEGNFKGYASVFNDLDEQGDRVIQGAFRQSLDDWRRKGKTPKMLWQHNQNEPIGWWKTMREDERGLYVEGQLLLSVAKGREAYEMLKTGMIDGLSIGCRIVEAGQGEKPGERYLKTLDLFEVSLVTFAANPQARVTTIKSGYNNSHPELEILESLKHLRRLMGSY